MLPPGPSIPAVAGLRRLAILALGALLIVACGTATPASQPASQAAALPTTEPSIGPTKSPWAAITPAPTPPRLPVPTPGPDTCPILSPVYSPPRAEVSVRAGSGIAAELDLHVTELVTRDGTNRTWTPGPGDQLRTRRGTVLGSYDSRLHFWTDYHYDFEWPYELVQATATMQVGDRPARPVELTVPDDPADARDGYLSVAIPDVDGVVILAIDIVWTDKCFTFSASARGELTVIPTSVTGACPSADGFSDYLDGLRSPGLYFEDREVAPSFISMHRRYFGGFIDVIAGRFAGWDRDALPVTVSTGAAVTVRVQNQLLELVEPGAEVYRRRDVLRDTNPRPVWYRELVARDDESYRIRPSLDPGRYVLRIGFDWSSPCAYGDGHASVSLDLE